MRLLVTLSLLWAGMMSAGQAAEFRFDMGPDSGPVAAGYTKVTPAHLLAGNPAFGWTARPYTTIYRNEPTNPYYYRGEEALEYALYSDGVLSLEENSFVFQVPPGCNGVTAIIGDLSLGEGRLGNGIWANGVQVVNNETIDGTVKAFTFPVDAPEGRIALRFRADSQQKYATVIGVTASALAEGETVAASVKQYPEQLPTPEIYLRNWQRLQDNLLADWETAKAELAVEGVDLAYAQRVATQLARQPGVRQHFGRGLGSGSWERLVLEPQALQAMTRQLNCPRNLDTPPTVKSHLYRRTQARVHLLNNTSLSDPGSVRVPGAMIDLVTGKPLATGTRVRLQPGHYTLWQER